MKNPKVSLKISASKDLENCLFFVKFNLKNNFEHVKWFLPENLHYVLDKNITSQKREEILRQLTLKVFKEKKDEIKQGVNMAVKDWQSVENDYFELANKIFKNHPWPKGKYIGYASIYRMYPRDVQEKTFFFPYFHATPHFSNMVIAHELLHFIFFDYIKQKFKYKEAKTYSKKAEYIWQISEVFNSVIENWEPYYNIFKVEDMKQPPYTGGKYFKKMQSQWAKNQDIDFLLSQWL